MFLPVQIVYKFKRDCTGDFYRLSALTENLRIYHKQETLYAKTGCSQISVGKFWKNSEVKMPQSSSTMPHDFSNHFLNCSPTFEPTPIHDRCKNASLSTRVNSLQKTTLVGAGSISNTVNHLFSCPKFFISLCHFMLNSWK